MEKRGRGKPTMASTILEDLKDIEDNEETYLVLYDHKGRPSEYFYKNLHRIMDTRGDAERIQASIIECGSLMTAKAIKSLATHYGAHVLIYQAEIVP